MAHLTFHELRHVSGKRTSFWFGSQDVRNAGWSLSDWATALAGEVGEACNIIKKLNRARIGVIGDKDKAPEILKQELAMELADAMIYLDLLAQAAGIELEYAVMKKFNEDSVRRGFPERLTGVDLDNNRPTGIDGKLLTDAQIAENNRAYHFDPDGDSDGN